MKTQLEEFHRDEPPDKTVPAREISSDAVYPAAPMARPNPWLQMPDGIRHVLLGALIIYALVCVLGALINSGNNPASAYLALSTFIYLAALAFPLVAYDKNKHGWFHPLMFGTLWTMVKMLPRRLSFFIFGLTEHAVLPLSSEELTRLLAYENILMAVALICTYAGFYFVQNPWSPRLRLHPPRHMWKMVAGFALVSGCALAAEVRLSGSLSQHFLNLSLNQTAKQFVTEDISGVGLLITAAQWLALALTIVIAYQPGILRKPFFCALSFGALAMIYLATGKRSVLITPIAVGAMTWMLTSRKIPLFRLLLLGLFILASFGFLLAVRSAASSAKSVADVKLMVNETAGSSFSEGLEELSYRVGAYSSVYPILYYVPDQSPLLWGSTYLLILGRPIPRAIWPTKPRGTDFRAGMTFFGSPWGVPPGPMGEAYWNFHIPGVVGVFFLFGIFLKGLANLYAKHRQHGVMTLFYAYTIFIFEPTENTITVWMQGLIPLLIFCLGTGIIRPGSVLKPQAGHD